MMWARTSRGTCRSPARIGSDRQESAEQYEDPIGDRVPVAEPPNRQHDQDVAGGEQDRVSGGVGNRTIPYPYTLAGTS